MSLTFKLFDAQSLYVSESNSSEWAVHLYYLMTSTGDRPLEIDFDAAWKNRAGAYCFLPADQAITDPVAFVEALQKLIIQPGPQSQWLAWVPSATPKDGALENVRLLAMAKPEGQDGDGRVLSIAQLNFGNLQLVIQSQTLVAADTAASVPSIYLTPNPTVGGTLSLIQMGTSRTLDLPQNGRFDLPLTSASLGAWLFDMSPNRGDFYQ